MLTADVLDVPAALHFLQYPDDLTFTEPALAHLGLLGNIVCPRPPVMRGPILGDGYIGILPASFMKWLVSAELISVSLGTRHVESCNPCADAGFHNALHFRIYVRKSNA